MSSGRQMTWALVCQRSALIPTIASSYMAGVVITIVIMGSLSDKFGRRTIIITLSSVHILSSFITAFSNHFLMFVGIRFFVGGSIHAVWAAFFVLMAEIVPENYRTMCGGVLNFGWNIGSLIMTLMAYFIRDWQHLQLSFAVTSIFLISYFFLVPESPRWLMSRGKTQEALQALHLIALRNGIQVEKTQFQELFQILKSKKTDENPSQEQEKMDTFSKLKTLVTNKEYMRRLILLLFPWFAVGQAAYGIHFVVQTVKFDIFAIAAIKEVIILVTIILLMPIYNRMNRTTCVVLFYILGSLTAISFVLPDLLANDGKYSKESLETARVVIYLVSFFSSGKNDSSTLTH